MRFLPLVLILACSTPEPEAHLYLRAATAQGVDQITALCGQLEQGPGECLALAAAERTVADPDEALALCQANTDPFWRDECFFLVAESMLGTHGAERAAEACGSAGQFTPNCVMHLWKAHARVAADEVATLPDAVAAYRPALDHVPSNLPVDRTLERRFWSVLLDVWVHKGEQPRVDLADCEPLEPQLQATCRRELPGVFTRALNRVDHRGETVPALMCDHGPLPERIHAGTAITYSTHPRLDGVAQRFVDRVCQRGPR